MTFGGMTSGQVVTNEVYTYDVLESKWTKPEVSGPQPMGRWCHSAELIRRELIVFGGWAYVTQAGQRHTFLNDLHVLDVDTMTWREIQTFGQIPIPRCQAHCF